MVGLPPKYTGSAGPGPAVAATVNDVPKSTANVQTVSAIVRRA
jgi:hypothetical protein